MVCCLFVLCVGCLLLDRCSLSLFVALGVRRCLLYVCCLLVAGCNSLLSVVVRCFLQSIVIVGWCSLSFVVVCSLFAAVRRLSSFAAVCCGCVLLTVIVHCSFVARSC